jgi:predicted outer membrane lipoprotein
MINYNVVLYVMLFVYFAIVVAFVLYQMNDRKKDREQWLSDQLSKSFEKGKNYERDQIRK